MSRENVKEPMEESLEDKAYDLLGDMLVERNTARYMHELEEDAARGEDAEMEAFFARQDQENLKSLRSKAAEPAVPCTYVAAHGTGSGGDHRPGVAGRKRCYSDEPGCPGAGNETAVAHGGGIYRASPGRRRRSIL